ncbi:competence lipoprotein comL precursor [Legionella geestiana]|uniref:Outer membrane protein assembly factor BamD n=1 Tax=Legionella geestiana TaxID=45065 RepID=A0A0W0TQH8_9GAMM|nr:outer membrane protein assembly factor BamD [Legionella geestiana]KTC97908.1 competence lipoprotein comL precursor [Legionella geestiana]QBS11765.1 outer membrane protein assembly factor BamD [Legionella geestiana]QDQ40623.1 outer membrane protein assembly factor BamD [Legionella geestiana]STX53543.1 competence lipoprotein comL precursor [Legionella geestiana]
MKRFQGLLLFVLVLGLTSCKSWWKKDELEDNGPFKGMTATALFVESKKYLDKDEYASAIKRLEALESMYPFSKYAERAQMNLIYAYYKNEEYPAAAATAERFIHLYPRAPHVDYAWYMKGLANFQQTRGVFANFLPMDESWRDPGTQTQAFTDFSLFVARFPESKYRPNAQQHLIYLRNEFAERELKTAKYYYSRSMYVAAASRASYVVKNYQQAPAAKDALAVLYHANKALGLEKAAADALAVYQATWHQTPDEPHFVR